MCGIIDILLLQEYGKPKPLLFQTLCMHRICGDECRTTAIVLLTCNSKHHNFVGTLNILRGRMEGIRI